MSPRKKKEVKQTALELTCAFLRKIGRPDAAQRLESLDDEEFEAIAAEDGLRRDSTEFNGAADYLLCTIDWEESRQGYDYWSKVHDDCEDAEGMLDADTDVIDEAYAQLMAEAEEE